jgi:predicted chitinase
MIDDAQLQQIMPSLAAAKRQLYLPHLNAAMRASGIGTTLLRTAAFVAQLAHESGEFRWMEEIWGPTPAQLRYEPPNDLAQRLGNTEPGDGKRFKGRGPIQITGRFNYAKFGAQLGLDLIADPAQAAAPEVAFATAGLFWQSNGLNELADARQFVAITRCINGGTNGLAERQRYYERAKAVLGIDAGVARGAPLTRGHEAIVAAARKKTSKTAAAAHR